MTEYIKTREITFEEAQRLVETGSQFRPFPVLSAHGVQKIEKIMGAPLRGRVFEKAEVMMFCQENADVLLKQESRVVIIPIGGKSEILKLNKLDFDWLVEQKTTRK